jgi:hypothetical protein
VYGHQNVIFYKDLMAETLDKEQEYGTFTVWATTAKFM